ncbi:hypothetical protein GC174_12415 [bacterium]|nr:hypothetical protein [bacterium]
MLPSFSRIGALLLSLLLIYLISQAAIWTVMVVLSPVGYPALRGLCNLQAKLYFRYLRYLKVSDIAFVIGAIVLPMGALKGYFH